MKKQSKIILGSLLITTSLLADITSIIPYGAKITYDSNSAKSSKYEGTIGGVYISHGNLGYLVELDISTTDITYKDNEIAKLKQYDYTISYSKYFPKYFLKGGLHHISTTDTNLGDGNTLIMAIGGYNWRGYDKYSYGIEGFYTQYKNGHDENNVAKTIKITQLSPNFIFSKAININTRNNIYFKINYIIASDYESKQYISYEVADTLYYKKFFINIKAYGGKMKSGVKDGGNTVYNTKDLLKNGYGVKIGYFIKPNLTIDASYGVNTFKEFGKTQDGQNKVAAMSLNYSF